MNNLDEIKKMLDKNKISHQVVGNEIAISCPFCKKMAGDSYQLVFNINPETGKCQCNAEGCYESCTLEELYKKLGISVKKPSSANIEDSSEKDEEQKPEYRISIVTDEVLVETVYDSKTRSTRFVAKNRGTGEITENLKGITIEGQSYVPYPAKDDLISRELLLLPSGIESPHGIEEVAAKVKSFIIGYVTIPPIFQDIATYYVIFTWLHDKFETVPYLRVIGDFGVGKTRFLKVVGSICYRPYFTTGATTTSPIFRLLDRIAPTLILDESDYHSSNAKDDLIKILNSGNSKNSPVTRSESDGKGRFFVKAFDVFSPKLFGARNRYHDDALESRCITIDMDLIEKDDGVPFQLPPTFRQEGAGLRNILLGMRMENFDSTKFDSELNDPGISHRLNQIATPLKSIVPTPELRERISIIFKEYDQYLIDARGTTNPAEVLQIILNKRALGENTPTVGNITEAFNYDLPYIDKIKTKIVSWIIKHALKLETKRRGQGYTLLDNKHNVERITKLKKKYGIEEEESVPSESSESDEDIDLGKIPMF